MITSPHFILQLTTWNPNRLTNAGWSATPESNAKKSGFENDKLRNHNARKTMIQTLSENDVPTTQIAQFYDHKSLKSIENYSHLSTKQQMHMSNLLTNISSECRSITPFTSTATPSNSGEFRSGGTSCRYSCPGQQSMALFPGAVIHGGQFSVLHQHTESITVAPSSLRKASVEENQSIQRLRCD